MSNVIQFLEAMGSRPLNAGEYAAAVAASNFDTQERRALLNRDGALLGSLLGGRSKMYFMVATPERDVPEFPGEPQEEPAPQREE